MLLKSLAVFGVSLLVLNTATLAVLAQTGTQNTTATQKTVQDRIAERKAALKTKLDAVAQARIKTKCVAAQKLVTASKTRSDKAIELRQKAYQAVSERMSTLMTALENNNVDTTTLKDLQAQVKTATEALKKSVDAYNQTLADLSAMDCSADPEGFRATLDSAKTQRQQIAKDAASLKTLKGKIIAELAKIKSQNASVNNPRSTGDEN